VLGRVYFRFKEVRNMAMYDKFKNFEKIVKNGRGHIINN
jgi:hypothetical protein